MHFTAIAILLAIVGTCTTWTSRTAVAQHAPHHDGYRPLWSEPTFGSVRGLKEVTLPNEKGIAIIGYREEDMSGQGTGWVISRKNRMLVTNAHVADMFEERNGNLWAVLNGETHRYKVERVWYHPGVRRRPKAGGLVRIRSSHLSDGEVDPNCPDVALMQLTMDGPDLPIEMTMANEQEVAAIRQKDVAVLGFPARDTVGFPRQGETVEATYLVGVIARLTDFWKRAGPSFAYLQYIQHTMQTGGGFSGSPIYIPNGHVIAVHNSGRMDESDKRPVYMPFGVRIDCVWELIVHHNLDNLVPLPVERDRIDLSEWLTEDPFEANFRKAQQLTEEARVLLFVKEDYNAGVEKCNKAIELCPEFALPYNYRSLGYMNYHFDYKHKISQELNQKMLVNAEENALKYLELDPANPSSYIDLASVYNNIGFYYDNDAANRKALEMLVKLANKPGIDKGKLAEIYSGIGVAYSNLDDQDGALKYHNMALRLTPDVAALWETRADFWRGIDDYGNAESDMAKARELRRKQGK